MCRRCRFRGRRYKWWGSNSLAALMKLRWYWYVMRGAGSILEEQVKGQREQRAGATFSSTSCTEEVPAPEEPEAPPPPEVVLDGAGDSLNLPLWILQIHISTSLGV